MRARAACNDAFVICHEIYRAARELVGSRVATTQLLSPSKFLWRPDLRPRLVEYVADFARAGERALSESVPGSAPEIWGCRAPQRPANAGACGAKKPERDQGIAPDSFSHVLPGRRGVPRRAASPGNLRTHLVGLGRGDSPARRRRTDPRRYVPAGTLLQAGVVGASGAAGLGVDKRRGPGENRARGL